MIAAQGLASRSGHLPLRWHAMLASVFLALASAIGLATAGQSRGTRATKPAEPPAPPSILRGEAELSRAYDLILDANFEDLEAELRRTCGPAPAEACQVLEATSLWWQIQLDPASLALDEAFSTSVERAIRSTEAWVLRSPEDAEAWFYLGGAYAARVQWRVLRDEKLAAARDGKRIKEALERSLALDPGLDDAYFGIGMYRYYADVAPASARILRFLLLLPGGNRKEGLEQMLRARARGRLLQGEADYQLHILYLWYERQTEQALELLRDLQRQYPHNPLFLSQIADIEDGYQHDLTASLTSWRTLLSQARSDRVHAAELAEVRARLGIARHLDTLARTDEAIEHLERIVELKPSAPYAALSLAYLRLGEAYDRLNARADAMASYHLASVSTPEGDPHDVRRAAAERQRKAPNARHAEAFRLSLEGWRQLERKEITAAAASLEQSLELNPRDAVTRHRYGRALSARRDQAAALGQFEIAIKLAASDAKLCPAPILGTIYLDAGQLYERVDQRDRAIAAYRTASTLFGAADDTQRMAARALVRLESR